MKRKTIILLFLLIVSNTALIAQRHYRPEITFGAHGGVTASQMFFTPSIKQKMLIGTTFGVSFRYMEEKHFGLIAELNYTQKGWKEDFETNPFNYSRTLSYLEIPFLTHISFGSKTAKFFVNLGPQIGYMISNSAKSNFDIYDPASVPNFPTKNRYLDIYSMNVKNRFDYGITAGLGTEIRFKRNAIVLEARYYYGLGDIFSNHKQDTFSRSGSGNIVGRLGYLFRIK